MTTHYFEIRTPKADFTGRIGPVAFADGVARVQFDDTRDHNGVSLADEHQISPGRSIVLFAQRRRGYTVTELDANGKPLEDQADAKEAGPPTRSASKADWKAYAVTHGVPDAEAESATRDQLAEAFLGPKEA
ncbi:hypothetical protein [Dactylosporangium salmoneum]|uniref:Lsr2-like protein n=1 Tax=Dactylosporangium salmoneum TaxID=53361 RepID=A0ABP5SBK6_9ACTN